MAKKITDESGNTYIQKKSFYENIWLWIIVLIVLTIFCSSLTSPGKDGSTTISQGTTYSNSPSKKMTEKERDQQILEEYTYKLKVQTTKSLASFAKKSKNYRNNMNALASLAYAEKQKLGKIAREAVAEMDKSRQTLGKIRFDIFKYYAQEINLVCNSEAEKINEAFRDAINE